MRIRRTCECAKGRRGPGRQQPVPGAQDPSSWQRWSGPNYGHSWTLRASLTGGSSGTLGPSDLTAQQVSWTESLALKPPCIPKAVTSFRAWNVLISMQSGQRTCARGQRGNFIHLKPEYGIGSKSLFTFKVYYFIITYGLEPVSYSCHNKLLQTYWLKRTQMYYLIVLKSDMDPLG